MHHGRGVGGDMRLMEGDDLVRGSGRGRSRGCRPPGREARSAESNQVAANSLHRPVRRRGPLLLDLSEARADQPGDFLLGEGGLGQGLPDELQRVGEVALGDLAVDRADRTSDRPAPKSIPLRSNSSVNSSVVWVRVPSSSRRLIRLATPSCSRGSSRGTERDDDPDGKHILTGDVVCRDGQPVVQARGRGLRELPAARGGVTSGRGDGAGVLGGGGRGVSCDFVLSGQIGDHGAGMRIEPLLRRGGHLLRGDRGEFVEEAC
jgi:hypothetical protein